MKRTLLDEGVPVGLRDLLGPDDVRHVCALGWAGLPDTEIIERATSDIEARAALLIEKEMTLRDLRKARPRRPTQSPRVRGPVGLRAVHETCGGGPDGVEDVE